MFEGLAAHGVRLASVGDGAHPAPADVRSVARMIPKSSHSQAAERKTAEAVS